MSYLNYFIKIGANKQFARFYCVPFTFFITLFLGGGAAAYAENIDNTIPITTSHSQEIHLHSRRNSEHRYSGILESETLFSGIGFSWRAKYPYQSSIDIEIRTSKDKTNWSDWQHVHAHDLSQDTNEEEFEYSGLFSSPMLNIPDEYHKYVEYIVELVPNEQNAYPELINISTHFIYSEKTSPEMLERIINLSNISNRRANQVNIVSRSNWGADESIATWAPSYTTVSHVVIHHTVSNNSSTDWPQVVRGILRFHAVSNQWGDIGYNYLIDPNGIIYEGRKGGDNVIGAHAAGGAINNAHTVGIAFLGDFTNIEPTGAALSAAAELVAWKTKKEDIDPLGSSYWNNQVYLPNILGHRDVKSTACPGNKLYPLLPEFRQQVSGVGGLKVYDFWYKHPTYADSNSTSQNPNFDAQFKVKNTGNSDLVISRLALAVHQTSGGYLFDMQWANTSTSKHIDNLRLSPNETYHFEFSTGYIRNAGDYILVAKALRDNTWHHLAQQVFSVNPAQETSNQTIFDGAGSLIKPTMSCWGCDRDQANMHPHSSESSTVVFQWMQESNKCPYLEIRTPSDLKVLVSSKGWDSTSSTSYTATLPVTIPNSGTYTTTSVTSMSPVSSVTGVTAYCVTSDRNNDNRKTASSVDTAFSNGYTWAGNGSIISQDTGSCTTFGCELDDAIGLSNKKALTAFQWQVSPGCQTLRIQRNDGAGFSGRLKYKGWDQPSWEDKNNVSFPKAISKTSNGYYYVFAIETEADAIPSGKYIRAICQ